MNTAVGDGRFSRMGGPVFFVRPERVEGLLPQPRLPPLPPPAINTPARIGGVSVLTIVNTVCILVKDG